MATTSSISVWRQRPEIVMTGLAIVSAMATAQWTQLLNERPDPAWLVWLGPVATVFFLNSGLLVMGIFFAAAVAFGVWLRTRNAWALLAVPVATLYAWSAAIQVAIRLQRTVDDDPHLIAASLAAGAVGAGITHLGCALFSAALRRPGWIALTTAVGAAAGLLFFAGQRKYVEGWLLYAVWQPAVAFSIGLGLGRGRTHSG
jgi:hypothetical protein